MTARLLATAHGTRSAVGAATVRALIGQVRQQRPDVPIDLCYLDVQQPRLGDSLSVLQGMAVVVPLLLSSGYHVVDDIPATAAGRAVVARPLGPDPVLTSVLAERLAVAGGGSADVVALVASPSTRASAARDLSAAASSLAAALDRPVHALTVGDSLAASLAALPGRVSVATYLLSEGYFYDTLRAAAHDVPVSPPVSTPLGAHPAIASLIEARYDEALEQQSGARG